MIVDDQASSTDSPPGYVDGNIRSRAGVGRVDLGFVGLWPMEATHDQVCKVCALLVIVHGQCFDPGTS